MDGSSCILSSSAADIISLTTFVTLAAQLFCVVLGGRLQFPRVSYGGSRALGAVVVACFWWYKSTV